MSESIPGNTVNNITNVSRSGSTTERDVKITWFMGGVGTGVAYMLLLLWVLARIY